MRDVTLSDKTLNYSYEENPHIYIMGVNFEEKLWSVFCIIPKLHGTLTIYVYVLLGMPYVLNNNFISNRNYFKVKVAPKYK